MVITSKTTRYCNVSNQKFTAYRNKVETTIERWTAKGVSKCDLLEFTNCIGQGMHKSWESGRLVDSILHGGA